MYAVGTFRFLLRGIPHVMDFVKAIEVAGKKAIAIGKQEQEQGRPQSSNLDGTAAGSTPFLRRNAVELIGGFSTDRLRFLIRDEASNFALFLQLQISLAYGDARLTFGR